MFQYKYSQKFCEFQPCEHASEDIDIRKICEFQEITKLMMVGTLYKYYIMHIAFEIFIQSNFIYFHIYSIINIKNC